MPEVNSPISEDEAGQYRMLLVGEIRNHKLFSRVTLATAAGLLSLGGGIAYYSPNYATLGYLLLIVGFLRFLNTFYDLQREDSLQRSLKYLDEKFERYKLKTGGARA